MIIYIRDLLVSGSKSGGVNGYAEGWDGSSAGGMAYVWVKWIYYYQMVLHLTRGGLVRR